MCFSSLANCCLKGIRKMYFELLTFSFWMLDWRDTYMCPRNFVLLHDTLFQENTKLLDMQWPVYCQIIWHYFQSHGNVFAAFPLIPSDSENCFTKAEHATGHSQKQADKDFSWHVIIILSLSVLQRWAAWCVLSSWMCQMHASSQLVQPHVPLLGSESHPFLWNYDFTLLMWQTGMVWGCREDVCSFCIYSSQIL